MRRVHLVLPVQLHQGESHNCWLASLLVVQLYHNPNYEEALKVAKMLLSCIGTDGLECIDYNPTSSLIILDTTDFKSLSFTKAYQERFPGEEVPSFRNYQFTYDFITHLLKKVGPFTAMFKMESNYHVVTIVGIIQENYNTLVRYFNSFTGYHHYISIEIFNKQLWRKTFTDKASPLYWEARRRLPTPLFYYEANEHKQLISYHQNLMQKSQPHSRRSGFSYRDALFSPSPLLFPLTRQLQFKAEDPSLQEIRSLVQTPPCKKPSLTLSNGRIDLS